MPVVLIMPSSAKSVMLGFSRISQDKDTTFREHTTAAQLPGSKRRASGRVLKHPGSMGAPSPALCGSDWGDSGVSAGGGHQQVMPNLQEMAVSCTVPCEVTATRAVYEDYAMASWS